MPLDLGVVIAYIGVVERNELQRMMKMWYVETLIDLLPLTPEQEDSLWSYAECLVDDEGITGDALEVELDRYIQDEFGIEFIYRLGDVEIL